MTYLYNTKQEMFNDAAKGLLAQGQPARNAKTTMCQYRTPEGLKCAVGQLIPDELYRPEFDVYVTLTEMCEEIQLCPEDLTSFAYDLQFAHDYADKHDWLKDWKASMIRLGTQHNLDTTLVQDRE